MMSDFCKCNFCKNYDSFDGCEWGCSNYEGFRPDHYRIIERAKECDITVADLLALIALEGNHE